MMSRKNVIQKKSRGQISILIIFGMIPMFTLFAFVINVGMMVNAKQQLQNAADLAAYAGAATQARQLNNIGRLNYQMRQVYKKFLYKYYVIGNMSLKCYPRPNMPSVCNGINENGAMQWKNVDTQGSAPGFPGVPTVCLSLSNQSNPCQLVRAVPIVQPPPCVPIDPTCSSIVSAANAIGQIQQQACSSTSTINGEVLANWLYATNFARNLNSQTQLTGLIADDLGLVTEEMLLHQRIKSVASYLNEPRKIVEKRSLSEMEDGPDPAKFERSSLAFRTALGNLNQYVFPEDEIKMEELQPNELFSYRSIKPTIEVWLSYLEGSDPTLGCRMQLEKYKARPYVGIVKSTNMYVFYAVKLQAKAKLLFNPFPFSGGGDPNEGITMTAYAAAAPFGSRIGPDLTEDDFTRETQARPSGGQPISTKIPFLKISADGSKNWNSTEVLEAFYRNLQAQNANGNVSQGAIGSQDLRRGIRAAMLPDEFEIGRYNIPVDTFYSEEGGTKEFTRLYRTGQDAGSDKQHTLWAPVVPIGGNDDFQDQMDAELTEYVSISSTGNTNGGAMGASNAALKASLLASLGTLMNDLRGQGAFNVAKIPDPLGIGFFTSNPPYPNIPGKVASPNIGSVSSKLASSFVTDRDAKWYEAGREGYSVKLIPFKNLLGSGGKLRNDGGGPSIPTVRFSGSWLRDAQVLGH